MAADQELDVNEQKETEVQQQGYENELKALEEKYNAKGEVDYTLADFGKQLIQYSYYASGFTKTINSFFDLIPSTYMEQDKGFYNYIKNFIKKAQKSGAMYDFVDQFFRHNYQDDYFVPKVEMKVDTQMPQDGKILYPGIIRKIDNNQLKGIKVKESELPDAWTAYRPEDVQADFSVPVDYVKVVGDGNRLHLYKYVGFNAEENDHVFEAVSPLGYNQSGNKIVEYQADKNVDSVINNPTEGLGFADMIGVFADKAQYRVENKETVGETASDLGDPSIDNGIVTFPAFDNTTFYVKEVVVDGKTYFSLHSQHNGIERQVGDLAESANAAINFGIETLKLMGRKRVERALINNC
jgi:hypothetical protein